jgi:hypothetical protein
VLTAIQNEVIAPIEGVLFFRGVAIDAAFLHDVNGKPVWSFPSSLINVRVSMLILVRIVYL